MTRIGPIAAVNHETLHNDIAAMTGTRGKIAGASYAIWRDPATGDVHLDVEAEISASLSTAISGLMSAHDATPDVYARIFYVDTDALMGDMERIEIRRLKRAPVGNELAALRDRLGAAKIEIVAP